MVDESTKETVRKIFSEYLAKKGHRKTPERFAILDEIYIHNNHFDIESLYIYLKNKNFRVSRATLYNTMQLLIDSNLVIKHQFGRNISQFEKAYKCTQHDHLICTNTGKVIEFCDPRIDEIINTACELNNFEPSHHSLYIYGVIKEKKPEKPKKQNKKL